MLGTNLRCLDNLNGIWGFDTSNSLQTTSSGVNATIKYEGEELKEHFDIINIDYYDAILGTPDLRKHEVIIDLVNNCLRLKRQNYLQPGKQV